MKIGRDATSNSDEFGGLCELSRASRAPLPRKTEDNIIAPQQDNEEDERRSTQERKDRERLTP